MLTAYRPFAEQLLLLGMFKTKDKSPGGEGFRLKLHELDPHAPLSPFYLDLRQLRSHPAARSEAVTILLPMITACSFDILADVPTGSTPLVGILSHMIGCPMISPRVAKTHGMQSGIDGVYRQEQTVLVIDDVLTTGTSILAAIQILRDRGLRIRDALVVVDREQGGVQQLEKAGVQTRAIFTISELLTLYLESSLIDPQTHREIMEYLAREYLVTQQ